jgi:hypothetical protein
MAGGRTWEGDVPCLGVTNSGRPCGEKEIAGLEYCLHHIPDDLLDEAEEITGIRRCRHHFLEEDACRYFATQGTEPPMCKNHGANTGSYQSKIAAGRVVEGRAVDRLAEIMAENGDRLLTAPPVEDPLGELLNLAGEIREMKEILRRVVAYLFSQDRVRYAHNKIGEQLRSEILLYERALERYATILLNIAKLNIADRLATVEEKQILAIETALDKALNEAGLDLVGQDKARKALRRHLKAA